MRQRLRWKMGERFALTIFVLGSMLVSVVVITQTRAAKQALAERTETSSSVIVEALASLCRTHLSTGDASGLKTELYPLAQLNRVAYIDVFRPDGQPLIRLSNPTHHRGRTHEEKIAAVRDEVLDLSAPVTAVDHPLGRLEVGIWVQGVVEEAEAIAQRGILVGLLACLAMGWLSWGLGRWLGKRLSRFTALVKASDSDDMPPFLIRGNDEITDLADAFNDRQDRLQRARRDRATAEAQRQDMIHMVVHDLKGPLGGFSQGLVLLEESLRASGDAASFEILRAMQQGTRRLLQMINGILQLARLEDPQTTMRSDRVNLSELVRRREREIGLLGKGSRIVLTGLDATGPAFVIGDADVLERLLDNLIFNALEHSPPQSTVEIRLQKEASNVRIEIHDAGPGIPAEEREQIFEKFRKGAQASRGVGLGLAFCKLAVERHQGEIGVMDSSAGGACFYIILPTAESPGLVGTGLTS
jgi:signal transduction histidine kinase